MRIIGGEFRSRIIAMPRGVDIRPTQDKVRQAVFNIIGDMSGKNVLELFAGTGAFGIESISRGARHVTFVDNNFKCTECIRSNIESLGVEDSRYDIIRTNALSVLARLERAEEKFDVIFLDPPYHLGLAKKCLINIDAYDILAPISLVVAEYFSKDRLTGHLETLILDKERRYGDTLVSIFRKKGGDEEDSGISGDI
ncbi:MAG: 16S rRNA (guanine(966)-N(2))-methyltransferase RsmD [Candidatus Omnitrophica bacterium]|nr:16S rRNA (guanine(966)-N(2))-methyltransferase RsmD [Candidatus Omnitrophota bacterium]